MIAKNLIGKPKTMKYETFTYSDLPNLIDK